MLNKLYQDVVTKTKDVVDRVVGVLDETGSVIACSDVSFIGQVIAENLAEDFTLSDVVCKNGYVFRVIGSRMQFCNVVFCEGTDEKAFIATGILSNSLVSVVDVCDEKYDRSNFIKNVILENILPGEIYPKSRALLFNSDVSRVVILIRLLDRTEVFAYDVVQNLFPEKTRDFVLNITDNDIALVKEVKSNVQVKDLEKLARSIIDTLNSEYYTNAVVGIGTVVDNLRDLARSFKEAQIAIEVGKVFDVERKITSYSNMGIGRLIYYLPNTLCQMFLAEVFKKGSIDSLDQETLFTIQKFFENNLNLSETSRRLFIHRNTLVYRLEKIRRLTGLDLKQFDQAIVFKVALMVHKYLESNPTKY